jgi:hypothetical protein
MRARWCLVLAAAIMVVSFQAHAANLNGFAANKSGQTFAISGKTVVIKLKAASAPVQAKLSCLQEIRYTSVLSVPPAPDVKFPSWRTYASAKVGTKWYYVNLFGVGTPGQAAARAVVSLGIGTVSSGWGGCGAASTTALDAAGFLIYR